MNKAAMLEEIREAAESAQALVVPDDLITYEDVQEALNCGHQKAQRVMKRLVEEGKYERVDLPWNGGRLACFRKCSTPQYN